MHRDERQHEPENTIMEENNEHEGQDSGCDTASCYAPDSEEIKSNYRKIKKMQSELKEDIVGKKFAIQQAKTEIIKLTERINCLENEQYKLEDYLQDLA